MALISALHFDNFVVMDLHQVLPLDKIMDLMVYLLSLYIQADKVTLQILKLFINTAMSYP